MSVKVKDRHISKQHCLYKARDLMGYILVLTRPREFDKDGKQICKPGLLGEGQPLQAFGLDIIKCGKGIHACCYEASKINLKDKDTLTRRNEYHNKAIEYANTVIDGGLYSLMTERFGTRATENPTFYYASSDAEQTEDHLYETAGYKIEGNVFWDLFQVGNQDYQVGNRESIWAIQFDYDVYKQEGSKGTIYAGYYCPVFRDQGGEFATGSMEDVGGLGTCAVQPTFYTRDLIYEGKWNVDMRNSDAVFRRTILGNVPGTEYYGKLLPWSVLYREDASGQKNDVATTQLYPISCKVGPDYYVGIEDGENRSHIFRDHYLIRLPETILLRAEAKLRLGDLQSATNDINLLRERAQCEYKVTASDMSIDLILDERARELVYE